MDAVACLLPQDWMTARETRHVIQAIERLGGHVRFVGGAVRDALLGRPVSDVDLATDVAPDAVIARLGQAGIKVVPTGLAHGTVTAVHAGRHFEITTLRRDVEADGRRAKIAYTDDWAEDAERRDFTVNALFAGGDGLIFDPVGGLDDVLARRVRFVGDPARRITEDVLRLLRYYRMLARLGIHGIDPASRAACRAHAHLLPGLSGERVRSEIERILAVADPRPVARLLEEDGILAPLLPAAPGFARLERLVPTEPAADWLRRLAALIDGGIAEAERAADRLRLSRHETARLVALAGPWGADDVPVGEKACRDRLYAIGAETLRDRALLAAAAGADPDGRAGEAVAAAAWMERPVFPLRGRDVLALGVPRGAAVGRLLAAVERWWAADGYRADAAACRERAAVLARAGG
ncbi:MAG: CCA tRNA nucleotidyltransferase [Alphaproteobacteria bacterium]|nr:CCA tRNA nucleotidyltransferase [Alphaproteobacteria bacterium]